MAKKPRMPSNGTKTSSFRSQFLSELSSESAFGGIFDLMPEVYFFAKDREGRFTRMNTALLRALGLANEDEVIGLSDADFFSPSLAQRYREEDLRVMETNKPLTDQIWFVPNSKGILNWYLSSKIPLHNRSGDVIGIAGAMRDARCAGAVIGPYEDLKAAIDYIARNFADSFSMKSVAAMVNLSLSQFERRFRSLFQMPPVQYLIQLRVENACRELERSNDSISQVASQNGFYDQSAFTHQFRKRIGLTPIAYRKRYAQTSSNDSIRRGLSNQP